MHTSASVVERAWAVISTGVTRYVHSHRLLVAICIQGATFASSHQYLVMPPRLGAARRGAGDETPSASGGNSAETPRRQRNMTDKKANHLLQKVCAEQQNDDAQEHLNNDMIDLKRDPELLTIIRGVIKKHKHKNKETTLRRGVRSLGDVPMKHIQTALSRMSGKDEGTFAQYPGSTNMHLFYWALKGSTEFELPSRCMEPTAFLRGAASATRKKEEC